MIAGVLPFIGEVAERSRMIRAISEQWQCSTQTIRMTLEELLDDAKMDIQDLPDPTIGKLELRDYGYTAEDMVPLRKEAALDYHRMGSKIYCLGSDGGKGEYQKYMEDLTDMQNHVLPYLQSFCSLEEKGVKERREQQVAEKNESREAVPRAGVEINTAVKDAGKAERKPVAQKKAMPGKEKKPSIHERLEINKRIIQEKQGKDKPERGADLGVRTV